MAIAFDSNTRSTATSFSHTCTGSDRLLRLVVSTAGSAAGLTATYNGVSMTQAVSVDVPVAGDGHAEFYLINPASGSNTVAITGATSPDSNAISYTGVTAVSGATSSTGTIPFSQNFTVGVANSWVLSSSRRRPGPVASTPSTGVTNDRTNSNAAVGIGDSGPEAISTVSHTWSGGSSDGSIAGFVIEPVTAAGPANVKTYNGLASASVKTINGLAIASVKTYNGLN